MPTARRVRRRGLDGCGRYGPRATHVSRLRGRRSLDSTERGIEVHRDPDAAGKGYRVTEIPRVEQALESTAVAGVSVEVATILE